MTQGAKPPNLKMTAESAGKFSFLFASSVKEIALLGFLMGGLLKAFAERHFGLKSVAITNRRPLENHYVFTISWEEDCT